MSNNSSRTELTPVSEQPVLRLRPSNKQNNEETKEGTSSSSPKKMRKKKKKARVQWTEDVVDNENMNKKKTKICCIFHPNRTFDEEVEHDHSHSDPSSSSSSDESDLSEGEGGGGGDNEVKPNAYEHQPVYENQSKIPPSSK
ncbi:uncharacterized protein SPAPADRAFT_51159 [Spathaspora passalidarum NRRL Y-27907]|uniref:Type 1 phosphatases regulator n=1 Tax=Spathaspora passalidarum (strain NRRL Y-27907 / 11-Y1) TaxID=619300 RepID=G3ANZ8_SPAPN|nr:uncharacterized protein SPAPADRAFT_51159 [Spathaspora passalidarum NRRL Y-27907]EGW32623.1 hypothetical protein SPAPADRAFT_51159 [Spathaspora passalidarum NRRL Y-27907]